MGESYRDKRERVGQLSFLPYVCKYLKIAQTYERKLSEIKSEVSNESA